MPTSVTEVRARNGSRYSHTEAQEIAVELEAIRAQFPGFTAENVVERASDPESALHRHFEWDDTIAAHQHRLATARGIVKCVVFVENRERKPAYVNIHRAVVARHPELRMDPRHSHLNPYVSRQDVEQREDMARLWVETSVRQFVTVREETKARLRDCSRFRDKFSDLFRVIDDLEASLKDEGFFSREDE